MKKTIGLLAAAAVMCSLMAGCSSSSNDQTAENSGSASAGSSSVSTDGSTSMEKVIGVLGETFEGETGITVTYNPTGSGSGIKAISSGTCDIGLSSRSLKATPHKSRLMVLHENLPVFFVIFHKKSNTLEKYHCL